MTLVALASGLFRVHQQRPIDLDPVLVAQAVTQVREHTPYADADPRRVDADVLMARVSEAARAIEWASERFWWRVERAGRGPGVRRTNPGTFSGG